MKHIPFIDLISQYTSYKIEILRAIEKVLDKGVFILGSEVRHFEDQFAQYVQAAYAVGVGSGTDALSLSLRACGITQGDKVIIPANAYPTVFAVSSCGAIPQLVDIDRRSFTIDTEQIERVIDSQTKAIIPVHLYGYPANMQKILELAEKYKLFVIEDCAQAHGTKYKGKKVGTLGNIGCFSFYPTKNLGAYGDGGMAVTNDIHLMKKLKLFRMYGEEERYKSILPGLNSRLDELQAAILSVKLQYLDLENKKRRELATRYKNSLKDIEAIELPYEDTNNMHVYHLFVVHCKKRNELSKFLSDKGIATAIHYPTPIHLQESYKNLGYKRGDFPITEEMSETILSLPLYPTLTNEQIAYISSQIKAFYERSA